MIFPIMVVDKVIPTGSCIHASFCKIVLWISFFIFYVISTANKSLPFFLDRPSILVPVNFMPNCCFAKFWSVSFTSSFPSKAGTFEYHSWSLKPPSRNISMAIYFKDATCSKFLSPVIRSSTCRSSFISATSARYFSV